MYQLYWRLRYLGYFVDYTETLYFVMILLNGLNTVLIVIKPEMYVSVAQRLVWLSARLRKWEEEEAEEDERGARVTWPTMPG